LILSILFSSRQAIPLSEQRKNLLILLLRACGLIDLLALGIALIPSSWIISMHGHLGMGPFPEETLTLYLARSSCLMYAVHGVLLIFVSFDVARYLPLIRLLAGIAVIHGIVLIVIDQFTGMPWWWTLGEGGLLIAWGSLTFCLLSSNTPSESSKE
jgi:hypothetical protein